MENNIPSSYTFLEALKKTNLFKLAMNTISNFEGLKTSFTRWSPTASQHLFELITLFQLEPQLH